MKHKKWFLMFLVVVSISMCFLVSVFAETVYVGDTSYDPNAEYSGDNWEEAVYALVAHHGQYTETSSDNLYNFLSSSGVKKMSDWYAEKGRQGSTMDEYIEYVYSVLYAKYGNSFRNASYVRNDNVYASTFAGATGLEINEALSQISQVVNGIANGLLGVGILTCILIFITHLIRVGVMPTHPIQRRKTLLDLGTCILCIALLGGIRLLVFLGYFIVLA